MDNQGSVSGRRSSVSSMTSVDLRVRYISVIELNKSVQISTMKEKHS